MVIVRTRNARVAGAGQAGPSAASGRIPANCAATARFRPAPARGVALCAVALARAASGVAALAFLGNRRRWLNPRVPRGPDAPLSYCEVYPSGIGTCGFAGDLSAEPVEVLGA